MNRTIRLSPTTSFRLIASDRGMTLLELLVVMVILGMLATLGSIQLMGYLDRAKAQSAKLQIEELRTALDLFRIDTGRFPSATEGLSALVEAPAETSGWQGPYLRKENILTDPWGRLFVYKIPGEHGEFDLASYGADGSPGGEGDDRDIANWLP